MAIYLKIKDTLIINNMFGITNGPTSQDPHKNNWVPITQQKYGNSQDQNKLKPLLQHTRLIVTNHTKGRTITKDFKEQKNEKIDKNREEFE